jgi:hypothetical protein
MKILISCSPLLLVFLLASCSVKKRTHLKGYYVDWNVSRSSKKTDPDKNQLPEKKKETVSRVETIHPGDVFASAGNDKNELLIKSPTISFFPPDSCADMIYFTDGTEIPAKVIEVDESQVKYNTCDQNAGKIVTTAQKKVLMIRYADGSVKGFQNYSKAARSERKMHGSALYSFGYGILAILSLVGAAFVPALLVTLIPAVILAIRAGHRARRDIITEPKRYKGKGLATVGLILGYFALAAIVVAGVALIIVITA